MPTIQHDGLVELVRQYPLLGVELVRHVGNFALPAEVAAVLGSEDMSDVAPRANGRGGRNPEPQKYTADSVVVLSDTATGKRLLAVVIEPQDRAAEEKAVSWPVYATTARKANRCPRAVLIAVCWDPAEAEGCRKITATGHPGLVFVPIVISADNAPGLDGASPYMTLFNAIIGAVDLGTAEGRGQAVSAINATGATGADHRSLCKIILGVAVDAAHEHLEDLMAISYRDEFVDGWYEQGVAAGEARGEARGKARGKAEGRAEGRAEGEARTRADDILRVLRSRSLRPTRAQRKLIESCTDLDELDTWFDRSLTAGTVDEILEGQGGPDRDSRQQFASLPGAASKYIRATWRGRASTTGRSCHGRLAVGRTIT
ncbi:MAG TPA: hypothetical protein VFO01_06965 [Trebonia sp.]|nr:hypothetical protein [Trebonia sp.]